MPIFSRNTLVKYKVYTEKKSKCASSAPYCAILFVCLLSIGLFFVYPEAILRLTIPEEIQGRVFAARNSFPFFTIPVGCFGAGKGSGAAFFFAVLWLMGIGVCLLSRRAPHIGKPDADPSETKESAV